MRTAVALIVSLFAAWVSAGPIGSSQDRANLALHRPATASSVENDEHAAGMANDGDPQTCWIADDEPEGQPDWWKVDLGRPADLAECRIRWPYDGKRYRYKLEASADGKNWSLLSDQTASTSTSQVHRLKLEHAVGVRYVKITVTAVDEGVGVGIAEVKVFGQYASNGAK